MVDEYINEGMISLTPLIQNKRRGEKMEEVINDKYYHKECGESLLNFFGNLNTLFHKSYNEKINNRHELFG